MGTTDNQPGLLPGTLDMLVLKTLRHGPMHGYGIALHILQVSGGVLRVGEGSLYPALQRLLAAGWAAAEWGVSENNRRAKYYKLTSAGRRHLKTEEQSWNNMVRIMTAAMESK